MFAEKDSHSISADFFGDAAQFCHVAKLIFADVDVITTQTHFEYHKFELYGELDTSLQQLSRN